MVTTTKPLLWVATAPSSAILHRVQHHVTVPSSRARASAQNEINEPLANLPASDQPGAIGRPGVAALPVQFVRCRRRPAEFRRAFSAPPPSFGFGLGTDRQFGVSCCRTPT